MTDLIADLDAKAANLNPVAFSVELAEAWPRIRAELLAARKATDEIERLNAIEALVREDYRLSLEWDSTMHGPLNGAEFQAQIGHIYDAREALRQRLTNLLGVKP